MKKRLAKIMVLATLGTGVSLIALTTFYWAPDRSVAELKQWQLPNSEFIAVQGMQAHIVQSSKCVSYRNRASNNKAIDGVPLIIHNLGQGTQEENILFAYPIHKHYRY